MKKFTRNCPSCGIELSYASKCGLNAANNHNAFCVNCKTKKYDVNKWIDYSNHYDDEQKSYFYICPTCNNKIYVSNKRCVRQAVKNGCECRKCALKNPCNRKLISKGRKNTYADPDSRVNSPEAKLARKNRGSENFRKLNLSPNNPSYKEENRIKSKNRITIMRNDPNSNFRKSLKTEDYYQKRSSISKKMWANPEFIGNSPEYRQAAHQRMMKGGFKIGMNSSKGEVELFNSIKHLGFMHNDFSIQIGRYYPDIIHPSEMIIVEYYGDLFHANPKHPKYADDNAVIRFPKNRTKLAKDIRQYDAERKLALENLGYRVYIVWERDFKKHREAVMNNLLNDLKSNQF